MPTTTRLSKTEILKRLDAAPQASSTIQNYLSLTTRNPYQQAQLEQAAATLFPDTPINDLIPDLQDALHITPRSEETETTETSHELQEKQEEQPEEEKKQEEEKPENESPEEEHEERHEQHTTHSSSQQTPVQEKNVSQEDKTDDDSTNSNPLEDTDNTQDTTSADTSQDTSVTQQNTPASLIPSKQLLQQKAQQFWKSLRGGDIHVLDENGNEMHVSVVDNNGEKREVTFAELREIDPKEYQDAFREVARGRSRVYRAFSVAQNFVNAPADERKKMVGGLLMSDIHITDKEGNELMVEIEKNGVKQHVTLSSLRLTDLKLYRQKLREIARESSPFYHWQKQFRRWKDVIKNPEMRKHYLIRIASGDFLVEGPHGPIFLRDLKKQYPRAYLRWKRTYKSKFFNLYRDMKKLQRRWNQHPELKEEDLKHFKQKMLFGYELPKDFHLSRETFGNNLRHNLSGIFEQKFGEVKKDLQKPFANGWLASRNGKVIPLLPQRTPKQPQVIPAPPQPEVPLNPSPPPAPRKPRKQLKLPSWLFNPSLYPLYGLGLFLLITIMVMAFAFSQNAPNFPYTPPPPPAPPVTEATLHGCANDAQRAQLASQGFLIQGPGKNIPDVYKQTTDALCILTTYPKFMSLLKIKQDGPVHINLNITSTNSCGGYSSGGFAGIDVNLWCEADRNRMLVAHELGHTIEARSPEVMTKFMQTVYKDGRNTMPTWNCLVHIYGATATNSGGPFPYECFSDMVGEYIVYPTFRETVGIVRGAKQPNTDQFGNPLNLGAAFPEFPTKWSTYYQFAKNNVYGESTANVNSGDILGAAKFADIITQHLHQNPHPWDLYYNKLVPNPMTIPPSTYKIVQRVRNPDGPNSTDLDGYYYCTALVIDSLNLAGIKLPQSLLNANPMAAYFKSTRGYTYLDYQNTPTILKQVKPGDVIFFDGNCGVHYCHVGIVYSIQIKDTKNGIGTLVSREANSSRTIGTYNFSHWNFLDSIVGFGGR